VVTVAGINAVEAIADEPLTTKEGWRRFVDRQPHPPVLLGAVRLAKLSERDRAAYDDGRRGYHADLPLVSTPIIRKVISTSRLLVQLNRNQVSARRGVIISGASGTGKTTALTQLGRTHELHTRKRYPADRHRLPVLYVTVPPAATARMLAVEFARFLGLEFTGRANITDIVNAVCATAAHTRVELVCVDELHNLNLATRAGAEVSDQLKYFAERLPATFVYAGIDVEVQGLFAGVRGRQIAGRFTVIPAAPTAYGTGAQRGQWRALIATSLLRLHRHRTGNHTSRASLRPPAPPGRRR
jgi:Bacterial TniB protein